MKVLAVDAANLLNRGVGTKRHARNGGFCGEVDVASAAVVAGFEVDGARERILASLRDSAETILRLVGACFCFELVRADDRLDSRFGDAFEEA